LNSRYPVAKAKRLSMRTPSPREGGVSYIRQKAPIFVCVAGDYIEERFLDCVSRRFAQKQKSGTLRSE
jgi:hypothetical protein